MKIETQICKCDWCGKTTECSIWRDTFYWVCLSCALKTFGQWNGTIG